MESVKNKNVLIVGATGGIGSRVAKLLAGSGANLFLAGRNSEKLAALAQEAGLDGIVCSGHEVKAVKKYWKDGFFVVPGLRPAGGTSADQKRTVTPRQARDDGASILVIGRPITKAESPEDAARVIMGTL